jgi:hypothetical protein
MREIDTGAQYRVSVLNPRFASHGQQRLVDFLQ